MKKVGCEWQIQPTFFLTNPSSQIVVVNENKLFYFKI